MADYGMVSQEKSWDLYCVSHLQLDKAKYLRLYCRKCTMLYNNFPTLALIL